VRRPSKNPASQQTREQADAEARARALPGSASCNSISLKKASGSYRYKPMATGRRGPVWVGRRTEKLSSPPQRFRVSTRRPRPAAADILDFQRKQVARHGFGRVEIQDAFSDPYAQAFHRRVSRQVMA